ncbi:MAG: type II secretion system protein GspN [Bdellovibrionaceae bacterium]|nr:type II secretion system protein GspN [Pseudobdellovibrionaceae bacterium]
MAIVTFLGNIFRYHKAKIFLFFILIIAFFVMFFPYNDLSDKVSAVVSENTNNSVYLQFDDLSLGFLPQPGLKMTNVLAETAFASDIHADVLKIAPSILGLITLKPYYGKAQAEGLFKGDLDISLSNSSRIKAPMAVNADIDYAHFDLKELLKTFPEIPFSASGTGSLNADIDADLELKSQPDGNFSLKTNRVIIPSFSINLPQAGGNVDLPKLSMDSIMVKGLLKNGKLTFSDTKIGTIKDDLYLLLGGDMDVRVVPGSGLVVSYYNLAIDFTIKQSLQAQLGSYMPLLDGMFGRFKTQSLDGNRYRFRMQFNPFNDPMPNFTAYQ